MSSHYIVLSRKYRPKFLEDMIGQDTIVKALKSSLGNKKVPHAFLFHGLRGTGKTTAARILARCLSCTGNDGKTNITTQPCGVCKSCKSLDSDSHIDVMEFDAASRTGVDDIREIVDSSQYSPVLGRYKIFIIDEVHMLSKSAFNALLKTLEEPPAHVKFIFATTELHKIPETVLSRCMTFQLNPVSQKTLSNHLISISKKEEFILDPEAAQIISEEAEGSVRDALSILEQAFMIVDNADSSVTPDMIVDILGGARTAETENLLELILSANTKAALEKSEILLKNGVNAFVLYKNLQKELYKLIIKKVGGKSDYSLSNLLYLWQIFLKQTETIKNSANPEHILNAAIIILAHTASFPSIEKLMLKEDDSSIKQASRDGIAAKVGSIIGDDVVAKEDKSDQLIGSILDKFPNAKVSEIE